MRFRKGKLMADISQKFEPEGCVTFTGESDAGKAWLLDKCKETKHVLALDGVEKSQAERILNDARKAGLKVSDPPKASE